MRNPANPPAADRGIGIEAKVAFLKRPDTYADRPAEVQAIETHMSWVFVAGAQVFKLKKPVRLSYLDFSTLAARRRNCSEEIRLNRRLAPGVYLGKVPLNLRADGGLVLDGGGPVVDWLVRMRRLPEERMLDRMLKEHTLGVGQLPRLAALLARFYARAPRVAWPPGTYAQRLRQGLENNAAALLLRRYGLPPACIRAVLAAQREFVARRSGLLEERIRAGHVVDGHGDLRPEHICLEPVPVIIDCLEFNRGMRLLDAADELAFLALECERLGSAASGRRIFELYARLSGDAPPTDLVDFYKSCRACLRAKLAVWHVDEENPADAGKWTALAREYLGLAEKYSHAFGLPN